MIKSLSLLLIAIAMTATSCLAQENPNAEAPSSQEIPVVSDNSTPPQEVTSPQEPLAPYEMTLTLKKKLTAQSITLQPGQDLIIYINNPHSWQNADRPGFDLSLPGNDLNDSISCFIDTEDWGVGWSFWEHDALPLEKQCELNTDGNPMSFHFKANHKGVSTIKFMVKPIQKGPFGNITVTIQDIQSPLRDD
ncbi:MAG: hypothetical protein A3F67_09705 [Verrucomicrobia bacterium RIFCSPHIGHO2_12_FULL_41_10]|nr:MAG: hypothetical protein A3F67_09705 [Verrucomicrobia bacterium RIFCSPHIGHO2_12_FULL_41_10]HLB33038.1 hypothetical protein [Chthoniobacterales bacterium]